MIADGAPQLIVLGDLPAVSEAITRLRSDLDVLCGRNLPVALDVRHSRPSLVPTRTLLVAGPNLAHATNEVRHLSAIYPECTTLVEETATVTSTMRALDGCGIAHLATHGHHDQDSVLFSRLDLVDGSLLAYDIGQLDMAPDHVILSSCDAGRSVVRVGDELLGFTAALVYSGTRTVVSSVARMDDQAAVGVMLAYHQGLTRGVALAEAILTEPLAPLVCFGCSWRRAGCKPVSTRTRKPTDSTLLFGFWSQMPLRTPAQPQSRSSPVDCAMRRRMMTWLAARQAVTTSSPRSHCWQYKISARSEHDAWLTLSLRGHS